MTLSENIRNSLFYVSLNKLLREQFLAIKQQLAPRYKTLLHEIGHTNPLALICQFEMWPYQRVVQWRLELDFDDYQWSEKTIKPHFLNALVSLEIGEEVIFLKYQLCSSFNDVLEPMKAEKIAIQKLGDPAFVTEKMNQITNFLSDLPEGFMKDMETINFNELEYTMHPKIQKKWQEGYLPGFDCIVLGEGDFVIPHVYSLYDPNNGETKQYWLPLCDTTLEGIEKYDDDIWTQVDVFHGAFEYDNQKIVFGDGAMGNEGFVASTSASGILNWAVFFTFSNPIQKAEVKDKHLLCYGDTGVIIDIDLNNITKIKVVQLSDWEK